MKIEYNLHSLQKRLLSLIIIVCIVFGSLFVRLFYLQVVNASTLQQKAESQWTRDLPITAERGLIYDCNGVALAVSYTTYNVYTRYREIKDLNEVALFLARTLSIDVKPNT